MRAATTIWPLLLPIAFLRHASPCTVGDLPILAEPDSLPHYKHAVAKHDTSARSWSVLGHAYIALDSLDEAERAFRRSIELGDLASAHYGMGLSHLRRCRHKQQSTRCLQVEGALLDAIERDSDFGPAYIGRAEWDFDTGWPDRTAEYLKGYLRHHPDDLEAQYRLALACIEQAEYLQAGDVARAVLLEHPKETQLLPVAAQAYAVAGDIDNALGLWSHYIARIPGEERALYLDMKKIASRSEWKAIEKAPSDSLAAAIASFWNRRDVTLTPGGRARKAEHYRRVWYARTFLSQKEQPWDLRGEIYVRYGEPDYRSRSGHPNKLPSNAAYSVKQRLYTRLNGDLYEGTGIEPAYPVSTFTGMFATGGWESWVYVDIGNGVEFVFEDRQRNGRWRWPDLPKSVVQVGPPGSRVDHKPISLAMSLNPGQVYEGVVTRVPDRYVRPPGIQAYPFYYSTATFRGENGNARIEVTFGVPASPGKDPESGRIVTRVLRTAVLATPDREWTVARVSDDLGFVHSNADTSTGAFYPDLVHLDAPSGSYQLSVQLSDRRVGKWGVYAQELEVPDYHGGLAISDIQLAWSVSDTAGADRFRKGDFWIIPTPTRTFTREHHPKFYYEVYNLQRDEFGRTQVEVCYEVKHISKHENTVVGWIAAGLRKLFGGKPQFAFRYDRSGSSEWEPIYFELDTNELETGENRLTVILKDRLAGESVMKEASFRLSKAAP